MKNLVLPLLWLLSTIICLTTKENCENKPLDLGLLLDSSASVSGKGWLGMLRLTKNLIRVLKTSKNALRVSILVFSTKPSLMLRFNETFLLERLQKRIYGGSTYIDRALIMANDEMFSVENGMRPYALKVAVLFTDGKQSKWGQFIPVGVAAQPLKKRSIIVFAVGFGRANPYELLKITSSRENIYIVYGYYLPQALAREWLVTKLCSLFSRVIVGIEFHKEKSGRRLGGVFVTYNATMLPLCGDNWGIAKTKLACKSKGFPKGDVGKALKTTVYKSTYHRFWKVDFNCTGEETGLNKCSIIAIAASPDCKDNRIATVFCKVDLRLKESSKKYYKSGFVEVLFMGMRGTICRDDWSLNEANVVCRELYNQTAIADFEQGVSSKMSPLMSRLNCLGSENSVMDCQFKLFPLSECISPIPPSLVCRPNNVEFADPYTWSLSSINTLTCKIREAVQEWLLGGRKINETKHFEMSGNVLKVTKVLASHGGVYICRGTSERRLFRVIVAFADPTTTTKTEQSLFLGEKGTVSCIADGAPKPKFKWTFPRYIYPYNNGNGLLTFHNVTPEVAGKYTCFVSQRNGWTEKKDNVTIHVSVYGRLRFIEKPPNSIIIKQGTTGHLNCSADGFPAPKIEWTLNGENKMQWNTTATLKFKVNVKQGTEYICVARSGNQEIQAKTTLLVPPVITTMFSNDEVRILGKSFQHSCHAIGNPPPSVYWTKDGSNVLSYHLRANGKELFVRQLKWQDVGIYNCTAVNFVDSTWETLRLKVIEPNSKLPIKDDVKWYIVIGGSVGGLVVILLLVLAIVWIRKRNVQKEEAKQEVESVNDPWEFPRKQLAVLEAVGKGAFGEVCKAVARGFLDGDKELVVAVKQAKSGDFIARESLEQEIRQGKALGSERHPNVCNFLGCITVSEPITVICEFAEYGDLLDFLHKCVGEHEEKSKQETQCEEPVKVLASYDLINFCIQIVSGMNFLHSKGVIHRDLAARNVLVAEGYICKITDFGLALERGHYGYATEAKKGQLPIKWSAPELLFETEYRVSAKIDVWSYGILMYEVFTIGESPYPGWSVYQVVYELQQNNYRMTKPDYVSDFIYGIMSQCWQNNPEERPSFDQLHRMLVESQSTEYLDVINVDVNKVCDPKNERNAEGECDLKKCECFVASDGPSHAQGDDAAGPSRQGNFDDFELLSRKITRQTTLPSSEPCNNDVLSEDTEMIQLVPLNASGSLELSV